MNGRTASAILWLAGALVGIDASVEFPSEPVSWIAALRVTPLRA